MIEGMTARAILRYNAPYAVYVHERNLNYRNGQWKYLSTPADENVDMVEAEIVQALRTELGS